MGQALFAECEMSVDLSLSRPIVSTNIFMISMWQAKVRYVGGHGGDSTLNMKLKPLCIPLE